jgi:hypothetical protein
MSSTDTGGVDPGDNDRRAADNQPARRARKPAKRVDMPPWVTAAGQRVQQAAHGGLAAASKDATERTVEAARKAKDAALPRWTVAKDSVRQRIAVDPEVAEQVALALVTAVVGAAGEHSHKIHPAAKLVVPAIAAAVGPRVAASTAKQVRKGFEWGYRRRGTPSTAGPVEASDDAAEVGVGATQAPSEESTAQTPSELADVFGIRRPPDPEVLYRPGSGSLELMFPLPSGLASLPWSSLSHRNRFFVLVAAWALRETDGIQLLRAGDLGQASEVFQECLIRAEQMQSPELIARSYEDLAEQAMASENEAVAKEWHAAAERAKQEASKANQEAPKDDG